MSEGSTASADVRLGSGAMFDHIADRYDLLNRILSLGIDQGWRRRAVESLQLGTGAMRVLDVATGTADLALAIARTHPAAQVIGVDPSARMIDVGRHKIHRGTLDGRVELHLGEAERLPFESESFDGVSIAFGIRNVVDRPQGLREMLRVTRPGGRLAVLELTEPEGNFMGAMARFHVHQVVPTLGAVLSGRKAYRYLEKSIAAFPPAPQFADIMRSAGWEVEHVHPLTFGVAHLFVGRRPGIG